MKVDCLIVLTHEPIAGGGVLDAKVTTVEQAEGD